MSILTGVVHSMSQQWPFFLEAIACHNVSCVWWRHRKTEPASLCDTPSSGADYCPYGQKSRSPAYQCALIIPPTPPLNGARESLSPPVWFCLDERLRRFQANLVCWCTIWKRSVRRTKLARYIQGQVTARAYVSKIWLFLPRLLNCWSICNQIWFVSTAS